MFGCHFVVFQMGVWLSCCSILNECYGFDYWIDLIDIVPIMNCSNYR